MALITKEPYMAQLISAVSGQKNPIVDTNSIAVAGTIVERDGRDVTTWKPLSSTLTEVFDDLSYIKANYVSTDKAADYATENHKHTAADIIAGTLNAERLPNIPYDKLPVGITANTVADGNHVHVQYSLSTHTHSNYAEVNHTHSEYAPITHTTTKASSSVLGHVKVNVTGDGEIPTSVKFSSGTLSISTTTAQPKKNNIYYSTQTDYNGNSCIKHITKLSNDANLIMSVSAASPMIISSTPNFDEKNSELNNIYNNSDLYCYYTPTSNADSVCLTINTSKGTAFDGTEYEDTTERIYVNFRSGPSTPTDDTVPVTGITLSLAHALTVGNKETTATVTVEPSNATNKSFKIDSSDGSVLSISNSTSSPTNLKLNKPGRAEITVTSVSNPKITYTMVISVSKTPGSTIKSLNVENLIDNAYINASSYTGMFTLTPELTYPTTAQNIKVSIVSPDTTCPIVTTSPSNGIVTSGYVVNVSYEGTSKKSEIKLSVAAQSNTWYNAGEPTLLTVNVPANEVEEGLYYYVGPYATRPKTFDTLKNVGTQASSRITQITIPSSASTAFAIVYPSDWGSAKIEDPETKGTIGTLKGEIFTNYSYTQIPLLTINAAKGKTVNMSWS